MAKMIFGSVMANEVSIEMGHIDRFLGDIGSVMGRKQPSIGHVGNTPSLELAPHHVPAVRDTVASGQSTQERALRDLYGNLLSHVLSLSPSGGWRVTKIEVLLIIPPTRRNDSATVNKRRQQQHIMAKVRGTTIRIGGIPP
jgi:hypothetical protein